MIYLNKLKPYTFYRLTSILAMPVINGDRKHGLSVIILAPSVEAELKWLQNSVNLYNLRLHKYFIEKYTTRKFFQQPAVRIINDAENEITNLIDQYRIGYIEGVTSYKSGLKTSPLKNVNTLVEINHVTERVINNPKDKRTPKVIFPNLISAWRDYLTPNYAKEYNLPNQQRIIFIPVDLWLDKSEYTSTKIYTPNSTSYFGHLINWLTKTCTKNMNPFAENATIILCNANEIMILGDIPEKQKPSFILDQVKLFLKKCKSTSGSAYTAQDDAESHEELSQAEAESDLDSKIDDAIARYNIKPEELDKVNRDELRSAISTIVSKTSTTSAHKPKTKVSRITADDTETEEEPEEYDSYVTGEDEQPGPEDNDDAEIFPSQINQDREKLVKSTVDNMIRDLKTSPADIVVQARLAGQTVENFKRNKMLREKYSSIKFDGKTVEELGKHEAEIKLQDMPLHTKTVNENLNNIKSFDFEKKYNETLFQYDFARILLHFGDANPAMYLLGDPIIEDISDEIDHQYMVTVEYEDEKRKRSKFSFRIPKFYQEKYLFLNEQKWNIIHQKIAFPVTKTEPNLCQVVTNYNKIRMSRFGNNISAKITKLKKILKTNPPKGVTVTRGNVMPLNEKIDALTTIEFDELGNEFYRLDCGIYRFYFALEDAMTVMGNATPKGAPDSCVPFGITRVKNGGTPTKYYLDGLTNKVYQQYGTQEAQFTGLELSDFLVSCLSEVDPKFQDNFDDTSAGSKFMYTRAKILKQNVPLILLLCAADPGGIQAVMEKAKINHQFYEKRPAGIDKTNQGVIAFADGYLVYDRYPYENSLLMNGLSVYPMQEISYYDMASRDTYVSMFDTLFNRRNLIDGIENFYYLLIDPITREVLERLHQPTEFTELLLYANGLLADNTYRIESDYNQSRLRSNEIVNVYLYKELCRAYANYKYGRTKKFSFPEDAIIKDLMSAEIVDSHSKLNVTLEAENDRQVKLKGPDGLNKDRTLTIEKRAYHPTMQGVIGINSTPSGEVGINRHMSLNSNITDARGFITINKDSYDGTEIMTPGELLNTFACESADVERVAMSISQSKHLVPTEDSGPSLINYDMERVAAHMSNDFAFNAKLAGRVVDMQEDIMIVQYADGTYDDIDLSYHADKNTDGGFFIMNQMKTDLKVGDRFKQNDILAYDKKYFSEPDTFGDNMANIGTLARVAIVSNGGVYEDACYLTDRLAKRLASKITREKIITVSQFTNIKYIVKKGQQVLANDPLLVFDDTQDEFTSQMLASMAAESEDTDMVNASAAPVITKVSGTVTDIKIYYTVPLEDLSPSLRKLVKEYTKETGKRKEFLAKYIDPKNANTIIPPSEQRIPDAAGRVSNIRVGDGVIIKIYVEYLDVLGVSDKITNLKQRFVIH